MKTIAKLVVFTAIFGAACGEYVEEPETFDEGVTTGADDSVAAIGQGLISTVALDSLVCPFGLLCVFPVADWDTGHSRWGEGWGMPRGDCDVWYFLPPHHANQTSAIINNQGAGAVSYFYDDAGPNPDIYIGQSRAYDYIGDLQARRAADGSNPNDRIDYIHVTCQ